MNGRQPRALVGGPPRREGQRLILLRDVLDSNLVIRSAVTTAAAAAAAAAMASTASAGVDNITAAAAVAREDIVQAISQREAHAFEVGGEARAAATPVDVSDDNVRLLLATPQLRQLG